MVRKAQFYQKSERLAFVRLGPGQIATVAQHQAESVERAAHGRVVLCPLKLLPQGQRLVRGCLGSSQVAAFPLHQTEVGQDRGHVRLVLLPQLLLLRNGPLK